MNGLFVFTVVKSAIEEYKAAHKSEPNKVVMGIEEYSAWAEHAIGPFSYKDASVICGLPISISKKGGITIE